MFQQEHMNSAPRTQLMSSQAALHVTSPSGDTSQEYEYKVYSPSAPTTTRRTLPRSSAPFHVFVLVAGTMALRFSSLTRDASRAVAIRFASVC